MICCFHLVQLFSSCLAGTVSFPEEKKKKSRPLIARSLLIRLKWPINCRVSFDIIITTAPELSRKRYHKPKATRELVQFHLIVYLGTRLSRTCISHKLFMSSRRHPVFLFSVTAKNHPPEMKFIRRRHHHHHPHKMR